MGRLNFRTQFACELAKRMPGWRFRRPGWVAVPDLIPPFNHKHEEEDLFEDILPAISYVELGAANNSYYGYKRILNVKAFVTFKVGDPAIVRGNVGRFIRSSPFRYEFCLGDPEVFDKIAETLNKKLKDTFWHVNTWGLSTFVKKLFK